MTVLVLQKNVLIQQIRKNFFSRCPNDLEISQLSNNHLIFGESVRKFSIFCAQVQQWLLITKDFDRMWSAYDKMLIGL